MTTDLRQAALPQKFRKTALVEAVQWFKAGDHPAVLFMPADQGAAPQPYIPTLEGPHLVTPGDWIAGPGPRGEFWPIKPDVFAATYEPAALSAIEAVQEKGDTQP